MDPQCTSTASAEPHERKQGTAITLVSYGEMSDFHSIKALTKTKIEEIISAKAKAEQEDSIIQSFY